MHSKSAGKPNQFPSKVLIPISKAQMKRGRLSQYDPAKNKLQSEVSQAVNAALEANIERKLCNYSGASTVSYSGTIISVTSNLTRGDASVNECTGILIKPKKLVVSYTFDISATFNTVRFMVFRWKDSSTPTGSGILQTTGSAFAPHSCINWVNHKKITVLYDEVLCLYDHGAAVAAKHRRVVINPGKAPIQLPLNGAGAVPQMDGLYVLLISDDAIAPQPTLDLYAALEYTDA